MPLTGAVSSATAQYEDKQAVLASVREYYGEVLKSSKDLKTSACTACGPPPPAVKAALRRVPKDVLDKFYGCGNPLPDGIDGLSVLDLGCGSGRDCFVAAIFAGKSGSVTGIDMTDAQLATARAAVPEFEKANPDAAPLTFRQGIIEDIAGAGVAPGSIDLVISNCVVNLSPNKELVLRGAYDALKVGGEMYFSDVYVDRRLPDAVRRHEVLFGECLAGALYTTDFLWLCRRIGFEVRRLSRAPIAIHDPELRNVCGNAVFTSDTYRLFKLDPALKDDECEDYGQVATYLGTLPGQPHHYTLDDHHTFETGRPALVCGNTAMMLSDTWLGKHFRVVGDRTTHFGTFGACGGGSPASATAAAGGCDGGSCC